MDIMVAANLLDYTINLYKPCKWGVILKRNNIKPSKIFKDYGNIFVAANKIPFQDKQGFLKNAFVFVDKGRAIYND